MDVEGNNSAPGVPGEASSRLIGELRRVRRRARFLLVAYRLLMLGVITVAIALAVGLVDLFLRTPDSLRIFAFGVSALMVLTLAWRRVVPALWFSPSLTDIALRLERVHPELSPDLASAVDFIRSDRRESPIHDALVERVVRNVTSCWSWRSASGVLRPGGTLRRSMTLAGIVGICALLAFANPLMFVIGAKRVLTPWSGAQWPRRTNVVDVTPVDVHPLGTALAMRAALTKSHLPAGSTDVGVRYRSISENGSIGASRKELLTWQERSVVVDTSGERRGDLFERLVEPTGEFVEYRFETEDDETQWKRIRLVEPPSVMSAIAVVTPPEYARRLGIVATGMRSGDSGAASVDLGPGTDERGVAPPALAGSLVELTIGFNKPVEMPQSVRSLFVAPDENAPDEVLIETSGSEWRIRWTLRDSLRVPIDVVDEYGIASVDPAVYRFGASEDKPAAATITEPQTDRSVLPTALIVVKAEGRDDVGLSWVSIEQRLARPAGSESGRDPSGPGGAMEFLGEAQTIVQIEGEAQRVAEATSTIDLSLIGARAGDEVHLTALAADIFIGDGAERVPTRSGDRVLRIISEQEFVEEIRSGLSDIRHSAIRIEAKQDEARQKTGSRGAARDVRRDQSQITQRLSRQQDAIRRLSRRIEENSFADNAIEDLLQGAMASLQSAARSSSQASADLDEAGERASEEEPGSESALSEAEAQRVADAQRDVEQQLEQLIEMLDRGEDNWVVRNTIENLLQEQKELRARTGGAAAQTAGRSPEQLDAGERDEMEQIVEQQTDLADRFERMQEDLQERSESLSETDPAAASAMQQAGQRAQEEQVAQRMEQAAQQAQQNQMTSAGQQQQQAIDAMEEMLQDLDRGQTAREEALKRVLESLIESIGGLIETQERQIQRLEGADGQDDLARLARGMITLNQNTIGVIDLARSSGPELAPVANLVDQASEAQVRAIGGLRLAAIEADMVREHETRSLDLLNRALDRAKALEEDLEQRQRDRKLAELKQKYREILESQVALEQETRRFGQLEALSRRDRSILRRGAEEQRVIRGQLATILDETTELVEAKVFEYAHKRLDSLTERAADALEDADPRVAALSQNRTITLLQGLLESLADPQPDESAFDEGEGGAGGGGGGSGSGGEQPLIPPVKELRLLRMMQGDVATQTRVLDESEHTQPASIDEVGSLQRELFDVGTDLVRRLSEEGGQMPVAPPTEPDAPEEGDLEPVPDGGVVDEPQ